MIDIGPHLLGREVEDGNEPRNFNFNFKCDYCGPVEWSNYAENDTQD